MALSRSEAHHAARQFLSGFYAGDAITIILETDLTEEYPWVWTVRFDSQEHIETGDSANAPSARMVVVPKTGEVPYFPPADLAADELLEHLSSIQRPEGL